MEVPIYMKKLFFCLVSLSVLLTACAPVAATANPTIAQTATLVASATPLPPTLSPSPQPSPTPVYPPEGYGPSNFPSSVNPLTGLQVSTPALLDRRPLLIKVSNLPRSVRPQWGLSLADIVFEYYTESGTTRFAAIFYGNNADMVGSIRSGRLVDAHLVRGYKAVFVFGGAYIVEMNRYLASEFANRMITQITANTPLYRYDPNGFDYLIGNTADVSAFITSKGIENGKQNLDGMTFKLEAPAGGQPGTQAFVRYSGSIYNRWDYDASTGKYLRFSDTVDDVDRNNEQYAQLTDRLTNQPVAFNNVVFLYVTHELYSPGIYDILFSGSGNGIAFRDGLAWPVKWQRNDTDVISLTNPDGTPFPFKPGTTCFEVVGVNSTVEQTDQVWRFIHLMP
jgi:hypothetical protein